MSDGHDLVTTYRIGWWTHNWWPTKALLVGLVTGRQPSRRADNGSRFVGRRYFIAPILSRLKRIGRPHLPWQAEPTDDPGQWFRCRRGLTRESAKQLMLDDLIHVLQHGARSPWQQRHFQAACSKQPE